MLHIQKNRNLLITGFLLAVLLFNANQSTASQKWVKVIIDEDQIANYLDFNSIQNRETQKFYTTARIFPKQANDNEMPLRRPYHGERCPCSYDFAINESHCSGRSSGKTTCFAPIKTQKLLISNSVNCETRVRSILKIDVYDTKDKLITSYSANTITGGAYPVAVEVSDVAELSIIKVVCKNRA